MTRERGRVLIAAGVGVADAVLFVQLLYYIQGIADSVVPRMPFWLGPAWVIFSFPGRYLYLLPALNHPFGFGEREHLILYVIAALNGLVWAGTAYLVARVWAQRRPARS
jgi:hypothetical protein